MIAKLRFSDAPLLLALVFPLAMAGCSSSVVPQSPTSAAPKLEPTKSSKEPQGALGEGVEGMVFSLKPLKVGSQVQKEEVEKLGRSLFAGMAKDAKTLGLLKQLNDGRNVQLVIVDAELAKDKERMDAPPAEGYASVVRVTEARLIESPSSPDVLRFQVAASRFMTRTEGGAATVNDGKDLFEKMGTTGNVPLATFSLGLAIEDYIARHAPGWGMRECMFAYREFDENFPSNMEEQRKELDRLTKKYADQAHDFYAFGKKPQ